MPIKQAKILNCDIRQTLVMSAMQNYYHTTNRSPKANTMNKDGYCTGLGWRWQAYKNKTIQAKHPQLIEQDTLLTHIVSNWSNSTFLNTKNKIEPDPMIESGWDEIAKIQHPQLHNKEFRITDQLKVFSELYGQNIDQEFICSGIFSINELATLLAYGVNAECPIMFNSDNHLISAYTNEPSTALEFYDPNIPESVMVCNTTYELAVCVRYSLCTLFDAPIDLIPVSFSCYAFSDISYDYQEAANFRKTLYSNKEFLARRTVTNVNILFLAVMQRDTLALDNLLNNDEYRELVTSFINLPASDEKATPLYAAVSRGDIEIAQSLLAKGADINLVGNKEGATVLHFACNHGYLDVVKLLIKEGANPNQAHAGDGQSPLFSATSKRQIPVMQFLIEKNADVNLAATIDGSTPLLRACEIGDMQAVELLLQHRANINQARDDGVTPLIMACAKGNLRLVKFLLESGASVALLMTGDISALFLSCQDGHFEIVKLLLEYKAPTRQITAKGETSLLIACQNNNVEIAKFLIENDIDDLSDLATIENVTPLHWACENGALDIAEQLLKKGVNVNTVCLSNGSTPLHCACKQGNPLLVSLLLRYGAETEVEQTSNHATPLLLALDNNNSEAVKILMTWGADTTTLFKQTLPDNLKRELQELAHHVVAKKKPRLIWDFYKKAPNEPNSTTLDNNKQIFTTL